MADNIVMANIWFAAGAVLGWVGSLFGAVFCVLCGVVVLLTGRYNIVQRRY